MTPEDHLAQALQHLENAQADWPDDGPTEMHLDLAKAGTRNAHKTISSWRQFVDDAEVVE